MQIIKSFKNPIIWIIGIKIKTSIRKIFFFLVIKIKYIILLK